MEGSKAFSKAFMARHAIPTAQFKVFQSSEIEAAITYVKTCGHRVVLKASGLAGGKGVLIPETEEEAAIGLREIMVASVFGDAGSRIDTFLVDLPIEEGLVLFRKRSRHRRTSYGAGNLCAGVFRRVYNCPTSRCARSQTDRRRRRWS